MSRSAHTSKGPGFVRRLSYLWRSWKITRATVQLDCCGVAEVERIGHELGASAPELHTLAGKWPDAEPLNRRLAALALDAADIHRSEQRVFAMTYGADCILCTTMSRPSRRGVAIARML